MVRSKNSSQKKGFKKINKKNDNISLHLAAREGDIAVVNSLIEKGANINEKDKYDHAPLHLATTVGHTETVKLLLDNDAKTDEKNERGDTPLHLAANRGQQKIVSLLLTKGAKIDEKNKKGFTPLDLAIKGGQVEAATVLLERGAKVNQCCASVLKLSLEQKNTKMVELLRQYGKKEIFASIDDYLKHLCPFLEIKMTNQDIKLFDKKTGKALSEDAIMRKLDKITQEKFKTVYKLFDDIHINQDKKEILEKYRGNPVFKFIKKVFVFLINSCSSKPKLSMTYGATFLNQVEKSHAYHLLNSNCSEQTQETVCPRPC